MLRSTANVPYNSALRVIFIVALVQQCTCFVLNDNYDQRNGDREEALFITVSSVRDSLIELNWNLNTAPTEVRLYTEQNKDDFISVNTSCRKNGYYVTETSLSNLILPGGWDKSDLSSNPARGKTCLNYWIAAVQNNAITRKRCLSIKPTWMKDNGDIIGDIPLSQLFIPGTHNSGCYDRFPQGDIKLGSVDKYVYNQDRDIWTQLVFGIRYLDIRVGYYNSSIAPDSFWVNHDIIRVNPIIDILRDIKLFLSKAQDEIVILDLHRFPVGFKNEKRHKQFLELLHQEVGDIAIPRSFQKGQGPTLNEIWKQKRRLIICYADKTSALNSDYLWDTLQQKWGNLQTSNDLRNYLQEVLTDHAPTNSNPLWASMAELTPTTASVLLGILSSTRSLAHMADEVNRNISNWYRYDWCNKSNIVATDFFLGNDIINIAIKCNLCKSSC